MGDSDRRRGLRIDTKLLVRIHGVDDEPVLRNGNVSVTGVYIDLAGYEGGTGSVERLDIATEDGVHRLTALACVVRVLTVDDLWRGSQVRGVAFELLMPDEETRERMRSLVRSVADRTLGTAGMLPNVRLGANLDVPGKGSGTAMVEAMRHSGIVLETTWPIERGAMVRLSVESPTTGEPMEVSGVVRASNREGAERYRVEVRVGDSFDEPTGATLIDAMSALLSEVVAPENTSGLAGSNAHLAGSLERVPLPSLISFFEMERISGALELAGDGETRVVYLDHGRIVDVEGATGPADGRALLKSAFGWSGGQFRIHIGEIARTDRFALPSGALVLDILRELDEAKR